MAKQSRGTGGKVRNSKRTEALRGDDQKRHGFRYLRGVTPDYFVDDDNVGLDPEYDDSQIAMFPSSAMARGKRITTHRFVPTGRHFPRNWPDYVRPGMRQMESGDGEDRIDTEDMID